MTHNTDTGSDIQGCSYCGHVTDPASDMMELALAMRSTETVARYSRRTCDACARSADCRIVDEAYVCDECWGQEQAARNAAAEATSLPRQTVDTVLDVYWNHVPNGRSEP